MSFLTASILIDGERIARVERSDLSHLGAQVIDLRGKTVPPGLIDTHVHATFMDSKSLPLFLATGVTTVRDVSAKLEKVKRLKSDLNSGTKQSLQGKRLLRHRSLF